MKRYPISRPLRALSLMLFFLVMLPATLGGEIYSYVDQYGVAHFSNVPTSRRYKYVEPEMTETESLSFGTRRIFRTTRHDRYDDVIREAARTHGIRFELLKAIIRVESGFDPYAISSAGAMGLMQLMPENCDLLNVRDPFDPYENVMAGTQYFKCLLQKYQLNLPLTLAAYNAGPGAVDQYQAIPPYPETQNFVERVLKYYDHFLSHHD